MSALAERMRRVVLAHDGDRDAMYREGRALLLANQDDPEFGDALREFAYLLGIDAQPTAEETHP